MLHTMVRYYTRHKRRETEDTFGLVSFVVYVAIGARAFSSCRYVSMLQTMVMMDDGRIGGRGGEREKYHFALIFGFS